DCHEATQVAQVTQGEAEQDLHEGEEAREEGTQGGGTGEAQRTRQGEEAEEGEGEEGDEEEEERQVSTARCLPACCFPASFASSPIRGTSRTDTAMRGRHNAHRTTRRRRWKRR